MIRRTRKESCRYLQQPTVNSQLLGADTPGREWACQWATGAITPMAQPRPTTSRASRLRCRLRPRPANEGVVELRAPWADLRGGQESPVVGAYCSAAAAMCSRPHLRP